MIKIVRDDHAINRVVALAHRIWREHYGPMLGIQPVDYMLNSFQNYTAISDQIRQGFLYFILYHHGPKGYFAVKDYPEYVFLSKLYVVAELRGQGLGSQALDFIHEKWPGKRVRLTVNQNNQRSIEFYKNRGFTIVEEMISDIGGGFYMDDYTMERGIL